METTHDSTQSRKAAVGGLAVVGFIALILIGIATAIYAASFLPKAFSRLSTANVYLSSITQPNDNNQLEAVNPNTNAPTSIPLSPATTTTTTVVSTPTPTYTQPTQTVVKPTPVYTQPTYRVVPVATTQNYYGLPDLTTVITSVGYLRNSGDTNSYVIADAVPSGYTGAVRFVVSNRGTNTTGSWYFEAELPGAGNNSNYRSDSQRSLAPGDSIVYTLGFDSTTRGRDTVRVEADPNDRIDESSEGNNTDTESIYLNGGNSNSNNSGSYDSNGNYCRYGTYYQNGRYYCETSNNNNNSSSYDSNGNYCSYGTYYSNNRYYCNSSSNNNSNNSSHYDSNGNY